VLSLELSYSGDAPAPDAASASLVAEAIPSTPVAVGAAAPDSGEAIAAVADASRPLASPVPAAATPAVVAPRTSVAPPRTARMPRPETVRHAQAQPAKAKTTPVVKPVSTSRREAAKRSQASG
jgi:hypothetical protein